MKKTIVTLLIFTSLSISACSLIPKFGKSSSQSGSSASSNASSSNTGSTNHGSSGNSSSGQSKITVAAHTLSDGTPPIDITSTGQEVTESEWNSFWKGSASKYYNNYNFTYRAYSGGNLSVERFTKNGYYVSTSYGTLYYERINNSPSAFYMYTYASGGLLRSETTFDIQKKSTDVILHELYVHMFDYSNYTYNDDYGAYTYNNSGFSTVVMFQGGYLTYLYYQIDLSNNFLISYSFETTIDIPESYYYG